MNTQCKWISFFVMSLAVILLLLLFYSLEGGRKCPNEGELMMQDTGECYVKNSKGPCMNNLLWLEFTPRSPFGGCSCPNTFYKENRMMLYSPEKLACYYVFTQAYCAQDEWLNMTEKREPICEKNICLGNYTDEERNSLSQQRENATTPSSGIDVEWVPIRSRSDGTIKCAQLGKTMEGCPNEAVVRFHSGVLRPSCFEPKTNKYGQSLGAIGVAAYTSCPMGSYRSIMGLCQPEFLFDDMESPVEESSEMTTKT